MYFRYKLSTMQKIKMKARTGNNSPSKIDNFGATKVVVCSDEGYRVKYGIGSADLSFKFYQDFSVLKCKSVFVASTSTFFSIVASSSGNLYNRFTFDGSGLLMKKMLIFNKGISYDVLAARIVDTDKYAIAGWAKQLTKEHKNLQTLVSNKQGFLQRGEDGEVCGDPFPSLVQTTPLNVVSQTMSDLTRSPSSWSISTPTKNADNIMDFDNKRGADCQISNYVSVVSKPIINSETIYIVGNDPLTVYQDQQFAINQECPDLVWSVKLVHDDSSNTIPDNSVFQRTSSVTGINIQKESPKYSLSVSTTNKLLAGVNDFILQGEVNGGRFKTEVKFKIKIVSLELAVASTSIYKVMSPQKEIAIPEVTANPSIGDTWTYKFKQLSPSVSEPPNSAIFAIDHTPNSRKITVQTNDLGEVKTDYQIAIFLEHSSGLKAKNAVNTFTVKMEIPDISISVPTIGNYECIIQTNCDSMTIPVGPYTKTPDIYTWQFEVVNADTDTQLDILTFTPNANSVSIQVNAPQNTDSDGNNLYGTFRVKVQAEILTAEKPANDVIFELTVYPKYILQPNPIQDQYYWIEGSNPLLVDTPPFDFTPKVGGETLVYGASLSTLDPLPSHIQQVSPSTSSVKLRIDTRLSQTQGVYDIMVSTTLSPTGVTKTESFKIYLYSVIPPSVSNFHYQVTTSEITVPVGSFNVKPVNGETFQYVFEKIGSPPVTAMFTEDIVGGNGPGNVANLKVYSESNNDCKTPFKFDFKVNLIIFDPLGTNTLLQISSNIFTITCEPWRTIIPLSQKNIYSEISSQLQTIQVDNVGGKFQAAPLTGAEVWKFQILDASDDSVFTPSFMISDQITNQNSSPMFSFSYKADLKSHAGYFPIKVRAGFLSSPEYADTNIFYIVILDIKQPQIQLITYNIGETESIVEVDSFKTTPVLNLGEEWDYSTVLEQKISGSLDSWQRISLPVLSSQQHSNSRFSVQLKIYSILPLHKGQYRVQLVGNLNKNGLGPIQKSIFTHYIDVTYIVTVIPVQQEAIEYKVASGVLEYELAPFSCSPTIPSQIWEYNLSLPNGNPIPEIFFLSWLTVINVAESPPILKIETKNNRRSGEYQLKLKATVDSQFKAAQVFTIKILNSDENLFSPSFDKPLTQQNVYEKDTLKYTIPSYSDGDAGQKIKLSIEFDDKEQLPGFIKFDDDRTFTFKPEIGDAGTYTLKLTLRDNHLISKQSTSQLTIIVLPYEGLSPDLLEILKNKKPVAQEKFSFSVSQSDEFGVIRVRFSQQILPLLSLEALNKEENNILDLRLKRSQTDEIDDDAILEWAVVSLENDYMDIQINFTDPDSISMFQERDQIEVIILQGQFFQSLYGNAIEDRSVSRKRMPVQSSSDLEKGLTSVQSVAKAGVISMIVINTLLSMSLQLMWGMINVLQLIVHLPLINITTPYNARTFFRLMVVVTQFEIFPTNSLYHSLMEFKEDNSENDAFQEMGYESTFAITNMGPLFLYSVVLLILTITILLARFLLLKCSIGSRFYRWVSSRLFFNFYIRFFLEGYLELSVASFINIKHANILASGNTVSLFVSIFCCIMNFVTPIFFFVFLKKYYTQITTHLEKFERVKSIFDGFKLNSFPSIMFHVIYCLRRLVYALALAFMVQYMAFQLMLTLFLSTLMIAYIVYFQPYQNQRENLIEILNECTFILCQYCCFVFTDFAPEPQIKIIMGWAMISIVGINLLINFFCILVDTIKNFMQKVQKCQLKRRRPTQKYPSNLCEQRPALIKFQITFDNQNQLEEEIKEEFYPQNQYDRDIITRESSKKRRSFKEQRQKKRRKMKKKQPKTQHNDLLVKNLGNFKFDKGGQFHGSYNL